MISTGEFSPRNVLSNLLIKLPQMIIRVTPRRLVTPHCMAFHNLFGQLERPPVVDWYHNFNAPRRFRLLRSHSERQEFNDLRVSAGDTDLLRKNHALLQMQRLDSFPSAHT
ncbi:hypothetical protein Hypma_007126 [Hypsizygus marmoreus]|uniref:Uncharacterized protein n=1 Tax=Hypsizygus marmoreus TaxID=39966 RepID=A0A369KHT0_HYPMA|nr:hypothetical protein Hypma_007126 [Hypsizygus marmoreus]